MTFNVEILMTVAPNFVTDLGKFKERILNVLLSIEPQPYDFEAKQKDGEKSICFFFVFEANNRFDVLNAATKLMNTIQVATAEDGVLWRIEKINKISEQKRGSLEHLISDAVAFMGNRVIEIKKKEKMIKRKKQQKELERKNRPLWKKILNAIW